MATRIPISTLQQVIQEAGLPLSGYDAMKNQKPYAEQNIAGVVEGQFSPQFGQLDEERKRKIETLAKVDSEFSKYLGDPNSKGYLENPLQREQALANAQNIGIADIGLTDQKYNALDDNQKNIISQSLNLYNDLIAQIKEQEGGDGTASGWGSYEMGVNKKLFLDQPLQTQLPDTFQFDNMSTQDNMSKIPNSFIAD